VHALVPEAIETVGESNMRSLRDKPAKPQLIDIGGTVTAVPRLLPVLPAATANLPSGLQLAAVGAPYPREISRVTAVHSFAGQERTRQEPDEIRPAIFSASR